MDHARVRRGALALLTGVALLIAPSVLLLTPAQAAGPVITILSHQTYHDAFDGDVIVGELQNTGTDATGLVQVDVTWLDAGGAEISTESLGTSTVEVIPPGSAADHANRSPFRGRVTFPAGYDHYRLTATPIDAAGQHLNHNFTVHVDPPSSAPDSNGYHHLTGTVTNDNGVTAEFVNVVATLYDAAGHADDQAVELSSPNSSLAPGASGSFDVQSDSVDRAYSTYSILAQSNTPGSAPVSPSPSASTSATASPSDTASASPSASSTATSTPTATPTPTVSPLPCRTGGGTVALAVSPAYKKVVKGGSVRLSPTVSQGGRLCQAGVRVSLYVRGPGTTLYHLSRSASTVAGGKALFDYTGIRADFRWYAVAFGVRSAAGLVQAR